MQEVNIVVRKEQGVTIKEAVFKLTHVVCLLFALNRIQLLLIIQSVVDLSTNKEVWSNIVTFCYLVPHLTQTSEFALRFTNLILVAIKEEVEVPLNYILGIGVLLVHSLRSQLRATFVVLGVTNVEDTALLVFIIGQSLVLIEVIHTFAVRLVFEIFR